MSGHDRSNESQPTAAQQAELLDVFLEGVRQELAEPSWDPHAEQIRDLHTRFAAVFAQWLRSVGRNP